MSLKILLVEIPIDWWNRVEKIYLPNPGTLAVGTYLKHKGYDARIIDTYAEGISWKRLKGIIKKEQPDIVGSSSYTPDIYARILLARIVKEINPSIVTILGGSHATLAPEETLRLAKDIDYIVMGEGEETFLELIKAIESGKNKKEMRTIKGIAFLDGGEYVGTEPRPLIEDLDELPMPDYSMLPMDKYRNNYFPYPAKDGFSCSFSRGCTEHCIFCSSNILWQHRWRGRGVKNIVAELNILNKKYGKRAFLFTEDNFLEDRKRNIEFIEEMRHSGPRIEFRAAAKVDTLLRDKDLLGDLRKIGLTALVIGIESYNQDVLNSMRKNYKLEQIRELSLSLKKADIPFPLVSFIVGNYEDNKDSILDIIRKTKEYGFGAILIAYFTPWPGTRLFFRMKQKDLIKVWDYRLYDLRNSIMPTSLLDMKEIVTLKKLLFLRWYFDISVFLRNLPNRYLRHYHIFTIGPLFFFNILYRFIHKFKFCNFSWHNRLIDNIYKEHLDSVGNK